MPNNTDCVDVLEESLDLELGEEAPLWAHKIARIAVRTYRRTAAIDAKIESRDGLISQVNSAHSRMAALESDVHGIKTRLEAKEDTDSISIAQTSKGLLQKGIEWAFIGLLVWAASQGSCTSEAVPSVDAEVAPSTDASTITD